MTAMQQPMSHPAQCEQASPFEQDYEPRRGKEERQIHFDFLFAFLDDNPAAVWRISLRSAGLMSEVSIN